MAKYFGDAAIPLKCSKCGHESQQSIALLETSPRIVCPACGVATKYNAEDFRAKMRDVDKAVDKLKDAFRKFGKS
jgi:hypothetical protein